jgi:hypothetical protein
VNGWPALAGCLEALGRQGDAVPAEVLVVDRCGEEVRTAVRERFPEVRVLAAEPHTAIPALRALGIAQARAPIVAVIEDHCHVAPGWLQVIERARREGHRVIGGAVANGSVRRVVDWAAFYCEYARFMPPLPGGPTDAVTGNNVAYDRATLDAAGGFDDRWEYFLHARLAAQGVPFVCAPDLLVSHCKEFGFGEFLSQRYLYSRSFAGMRLGGAPAWRRGAYALATPLLPPVLFARIARAVLARPGHAARFLAAAPALLVFVIAWAAGEAMGALRGPGDSLARVE